MILDMKTAYEAYRKCWGLPRPWFFDEFI
jgi:hypothetical protein